MNSTQIKPTKKELLLHELRDIFGVMLYLAVSLSVLATFKGLALIQVGINEFAQLYTGAIVNALALGKFVVMAQNIPIMNAMDHKPLIWSVLYKSVLMTLIIDIASAAEETIFASITKHQASPSLHPIMFMVAHQITAMFIAMILFTVRGLDQRLGPGKLLQFLIGKPE